MRLLLRLVLLLVVAVALSAAWLFRSDLLRVIEPQVARVGEAVGVGGGVSEKDPVPGPEELERARDKVDSLHGWAADSVVLSPREMASLLVEGLPPAARGRLDSVRLTLGEDRVTVTGRLETTQIPASVLGPLAGALDPWEKVTGSGLVTATAPGWAEWRVDALTLRGFTLPSATSRQLISRALPGVRDGAVPFRLPPGIARIRIRTTGATLYREPR